uniref:carboxypeptidase-like regulatory domain-containing protein n=1 Tax=uncultured Porphyromonas sp. TaxID=159274 RepID=UPI00261FA17D
MKSMLHRVMLALLLLLASEIQLAAQHSETTGSIVGTVVDASTHEALPYVQIIVKGTTVGTTTDANGAFILPNLRPGTYILEARLLGYALESSGVAIQAGHSRHHDFYLRQQAIDLDGVVISANRHETMRRSAPS